MALLPGLGYCVLVTPENDDWLVRLRMDPEDFSLNPDINFGDGLVASPVANIAISMIFCVRLFRDPQLHPTTLLDVCGSETLIYNYL